MTEEIIHSKQRLNQEIRKILWEEPEDNIQFPATLLFRESFHSPMFKFTIEKIEKDYFIDENGQKWVKS